MVKRSSARHQSNLMWKVKNGARTTGSPQVIRKWTRILYLKSSLKTVLRQIRLRVKKPKTSKFIGENWENIFVTLEKARNFSNTRNNPHKI